MHTKWGRGGPGEAGSSRVSGDIPNKTVFSREPRTRGAAGEEEEEEDAGGEGGGRGTEDSPSISGSSGARRGYCSPYARGPRPRAIVYEAGWRGNAPADNSQTKGQASRLRATTLSTRTSTRMRQLRIPSSPRRAYTGRSPYAYVFLQARERARAHACKTRIIYVHVLTYIHAPVYIYVRIRTYTPVYMPNIRPMTFGTGRGDKRVREDR